ncbi:hypothetical protein C9374_013527 [Naegleria lovaniensis]|uniref:Uncharacterized protein n=1 Tax=Naegleria lovaniensis TaxID=51637 RepID=A0AA88H2K3_NAELO|nr:uncharacterized protein C9374_013527 [Naegleria lovaniensis]KAG2392042.1 hypothetical protein C9374_013527 [Naegleria lovaniensis]
MESIQHIAVFISDHGLGHLTRLAPTINELSRKFPNAQFHIITNVNKFFISERLQEVPREQIRLLNIKISVGLIEEENTVSTCPFKTIEKWKQHWDQHYKCLYGDGDDIQTPITAMKQQGNDVGNTNTTSRNSSMVFTIEEFLQPFQIQLVVWDVPDIAPVIAKRLNEKYSREGGKSKWPVSVGISNWCWEWIYEHCMDHFPQDIPKDRIVGHIHQNPVTFQELEQQQQFMVKQSRLLYSTLGKTDLFIQLPYPTEELPFNRDVTVVKPLDNSWPITETIKKAKFTKDQMKQWIFSKSRLASNKTMDLSHIKIMMFSFGGLSFPSSTLIQEKEPTWEIPNDWLIVVMCSSKIEGEALPANVVNLTFLDLGNECIDFARDLLLAVDVLVGKTSYGTVTETLFHQIPTMYLERYGMIEHGFTERALIDNLGKGCTCKVEGDEVVNALPSLFLKASHLIESKKRTSLESNDQCPRRVDLDFNGGQKAAEMICSFLLDNV